MKKFITGFLCAALVLTMAACGNVDNNKNSEDTIDSVDAENATEADVKSGDLTPITFVLDWTPNTNHTGLYVALANGYFEEEGLDVTIVQPPEDGATTLVASGEAEFGIDFQDYLAPAFIGDNKMPVTAVATLIQHNTSGIVSLKENGIDSPKGMENHVYATWELPVEQEMIKNILEEDGGDIDKVEFLPTYVIDVVTALQTDIDCVWIYYAWDGIACEKAGLDTNYFNFADINPVFDYYSPVMIANNDFLESNPDEAKAFMRACKKGYEFAIENPDEAAEILVEQVPELDIEMVKASQEWLADQYKAEVEQWGYIDQARWDSFYEWLYENQLIDEEIPAGFGFSNDYLD